MSAPNPGSDPSEAERNSEVLVAIIRGYDSRINVRAQRCAKNELRHWTPDELKRLLTRLQPSEMTAGNQEVHGPRFNVSSRWAYAGTAVLGGMAATGMLMLSPLQAGASASLAANGRLREVGGQVWKPSADMLNWATESVRYVKAPTSMMKEAARRGEALCVNRLGRFSIRRDGYAVMSHVWAETRGWQGKAGFGAVSEDLRAKGIVFEHFLRFFDRCEAQWLWVDFLAVPEDLESINESTKREARELRMQVTNCSRGIYTRADKVVVLDGLLLRLDSASKIDVAVVLCLGWWMTRLWTFVEARLAKKLILKTRTSSFDMDEILALLYRTVYNDEHRYARLLDRLWPLRPIPVGFISPAGFTAERQEDLEYLFTAIMWGRGNRWFSGEEDLARALFPLLDLQWRMGWGLKDGLKHIKEAYPQQERLILQYCILGY